MQKSSTINLAKLTDPGFEFPTGCKTAVFDSNGFSRSVKSSRCERRSERKSVNDADHQRNAVRQMELD